MDFLIESGGFRRPPPGIPVRPVVRHLYYDARMDRHPRTSAGFPDPRHQHVGADWLVLDDARRKRRIGKALEALHWAGFHILPAPGLTTHERWFDTADEALHRAGWSLALRESATSRTLALLEIAPGGDCVEQAIPIEDDTGLPPTFGPVRQRLEALLPDARPLLPLARLRRKADRWLLRHPELPRSVVELRVESVRWREAALRHTTLVAHLQNGHRELLDQVRQTLDAVPGLARARLTDADRARLLQGALARRSDPPVGHHLDAHSRWVDLAGAHLQQQFRQLRTCAPFAWEAMHPEGVHQMRVATRRLREALCVFADVLPATERDRLADDLAWLGRRLGVVRDCDVQRARLDGYARRLAREGVKLPAALETELEARRRQAQANLRRALDGPRYQRLLDDHRALRGALVNLAGGMAETTIGRAAPEHVAPALAGLIKRGNRLTPLAPAAKLHRFRIRAKHLRYLLEFVAPASSTPLAPVIAGLTTVQDALGDLQDATVATAELQRHLRAARARPRVRAGLRRLLELEARAARRARDTFFDSWRAFVPVARAALDSISRS